ncbi:MAG: ABC transporter permease subunit [Deinococcus-Thermus bacterium]|nr:ABC transporter permease subunit [Deinococcota bacterium]
MTRRRLARWLGRPRSRGALAILAPLALAALLAPLYPRSPTQQDLRSTLAPPGTVTEAGVVYPLGTDELGRDLAARLLHGLRASIAVGAAALAIAVTVGTLLGLLAGYFGGWVDAVVTGVTETLMTLPFILLAIAVIAAVGASTQVLILTLGLTGWVSFAKLVRAKTFELRSEDFVQAAHALGVRTPGTLARHVLPNVAPLLLVDGTLQFGALVLAEAGLSFLGLGVPPPAPTLGGILAGGQVFLAVAWWISTLPGLVLLALVLAINVLGDTLRDAASPGG